MVNACARKFSDDEQAGTCPDCSHAIIGHTGTESCVICRMEYTLTPQWRRQQARIHRQSTCGDREGQMSESEVASGTTYEVHLYFDGPVFQDDATVAVTAASEAEAVREAIAQVGVPKLGGVAPVAAHGSTR